MKVFSFLLVFFLSGCSKRAVELYDNPRMVDVYIKVRNFDIYHDNNQGEQEKFSTIRIRALDVLSKSIKEAFEELAALDGDNALPIYDVSCYVTKNISRTSVSSKHTYGAAIDINSYMNPAYYANLKGMVPDIQVKKEEDILDSLKKIHMFTHSDLCKCGLHSEDGRKIFVSNFIRLPADYNDFFMNRYIKRPGMVTPFHAKIMKKHGFDRWGGNWRYPIDYMHFEVADREFIYRLLSSSIDEGKELWRRHIEQCRKRLAKEFKNEEMRLLNRKNLLGIH